MQKLKGIILRNLLKMSSAVMVLILAVAVLLQVLLVQEQTRESARSTFS